LRCDRLDQAFAAGVESRGCETGKAEIGCAGSERLCHRLIGLVGGHAQIDPFGFEIALRRGQKQRAILGQPLCADENALLRGSRARQADDNAKKRKLKTAHSCRLAMSCIRKDE
jgi:hypothetical protein